ncbi:MAG: TlpA family protein disulfide reductase [Mycobacteriales bacterium]
MSGARTRMWPAVAVATGLALLAGCTSSHHPRPGPDPAPSVRALQAKANLAGCPKPGPAASSTRLPKLTLDCLGAGKPVALHRLTGRPTLLVLWGSWCGPCRTELPQVQRFGHAAADRLRVLGVDTEEPAQSFGLSYLIDHHLHFANVYDEQGSASHQLGIPALPATVFVRSDGSVASLQPRPMTYDLLRSLSRTYLSVSVVG